MMPPLARTTRCFLLDCAGSGDLQVRTMRASPMETSAVIIQTAPADTPRLAIMMYEHTALCLQFAHAFGNDRFEPLSPG